MHIVTFVQIVSATRRSSWSRCRRRRSRPSWRGSRSSLSSISRRRSRSGWGRSGGRTGNGRSRSGGRSGGTRSVRSRSMPGWCGSGSSRTGTSSRSRRRSRRTSSSFPARRAKGSRRNILSPEHLIIFAIETLFVIAIGGRTGKGARPTIAKSTLNE